MKYRFQWTAPILISRHDPQTVYHAANVLFRTKDAGQTWEPVSKDLTRDDKQKQQWSGGPITGDNTGAEVYCTIFALAESPKQKGVLWAGSDDGLVHVSKDEGKTWTNVTANIPGMPDWGTVCCIEASPHDAGTAFLVVRNHRMDDYKPYVWKTTDFGKTWTAITDGLDGRTHCHAIREDGKKKGLLYLGTERGVMYSLDAGKTWKSLQQNLPTVPVHDLVVKGDDLVVGTHGRSIWILDDLTPLRETTDAIRAKQAHLFPVQPATRWRVTWAGPTAGFARSSSGQNPADGAEIWFQLGKEFSGETKLEILDSKGTVIAKAAGKFDPKPAEKSDAKDDDDDDDKPKPRKLEPKPGLNRFIWDLTHDGATVITGAAVDSGGAGARIPVAPGIFSARLKVGPLTLDQKLEVKCDPRWLNARNVAEAAVPAPPLADSSRLELVKIPPHGRDPEMFKLIRELSEQITRTRRGEVPDLLDQEQLSLRVRDDISKLSDTVARLRAVKKQITLRKELLKDRDDAKELLKGSEALDKSLNEVEEKLHNPKAKISYDIFAAKGGAMLYSQYAWLLSNLVDADGAPTKAQMELADDLGKQLVELVAKFEGVARDNVAKLNDAAKELGVPELYVPPPTSKKEEAKPKESK